MSPLENRLYEVYLKLGNEAHIFGNEEGCDVDVMHECIDELGDIQNDVEELIISHDEAIAALSTKLEAYRAALQREVDNCVNCDGLGKYEAFNFTKTCERCAASRHLLESK